MPAHHRLVRLAFFGCLMLAGCSQSTDPVPLDATGLSAGAASETSALAAHRFVPSSNNPYFPLVPGTTLHYRARTDEGIETGEFKVTHRTKRILGIITRVVEDIVRLDGEVIEHTFDWFAMDERGNVWYFGEDVRNIDPETGEIDKAGSWEAGVAGAEAGIIMLANPRVGDAYDEENAIGVAEDKARVLSLTAHARVPAGNFKNCLQTENWTPLEPDLREHKFYAPGIGLVLEVDVAGGGQRNELLRVTRPMAPGDDDNDGDDGKRGDRGAEGARDRGDRDWGR